MCAMIPMLRVCGRSAGGASLLGGAAAAVAYWLNGTSTGRRECLDRREDAGFARRRQREGAGGILSTMSAWVEGRVWLCSTAYV